MGGKGATVFPELCAPVSGGVRGDVEADDTRRLLPVTVADGRVAADGTAILAGLAAGVTESGQVRSDVGVVLGLTAAAGAPTSSEDTVLGSLCCKRCGCLALPLPLPFVSAGALLAEAAVSFCVVRFLACARIKIYWCAPCAAARLAVQSPQLSQRGLNVPGCTQDDARVGQLRAGPAARDAVPAAAAARRRPIRGAAAAH